MKIAHLTSVHPRYDTRIFHKMCKSLAPHYDVTLVVADGLGDEVTENVHIVDVGAACGRFDRVKRIGRKVLEKAKSVDAQLYHLHDPELIPVGKKLKKMGKKVIFDAHEDLPKQIMAKHYIPDSFKSPVSKAAAFYECAVLRHFDAVVAATPFIEEKFIRCGARSVTVANYPDAERYLSVTPAFHNRTICYVGTLYKTRGIEEIIRAVAEIDVELILAGKFYDAFFRAHLEGLKGWSKVDFRGFVGQEEIRGILKESSVGLVTLHPTPSYLEAYPVKMFEYMAAGLPTLASDFPLYRDIVERNGCGRCVDPLKVEEIGEAIEEMLSDVRMLEKMGSSGKKIVSEKYNWKYEVQKLLELYRNLLN